MNLDGILFAAVFVAVIGLILSKMYMSPRQVAKRALGAVQLVPIARASEGSLVKVTGRLSIVGEPLRAPLSGRECAAWHVEVDQHESSGDGGGSWKNIIWETSAGTFLFQDSTGRAIVNALGARLVLVLDAHFKSGTFNDARPQLEAYLTSHGHESTGFLGFNKAIRYREGALEAGEEVTVLGQAHWEPDPDPHAPSQGYRQRAMRLVLDIPSGEAEMIVSDDPNLGR